MSFMQTESVLQAKNRSGPAKNQFSVALLGNMMLSKANPNKMFNEPHHEKSCLMPYANNKGADQPAHPRSLISAFVVRYVDSIMPLQDPS